MLRVLIACASLSECLHTCVSLAVTKMVASREAGEAAQKRCAELESELSLASADLEASQRELREQKVKQEAAAHAARMQLDLLGKQRDEARDEASAGRSSMRKSKKEERKAQEETLEPFQKEIKRLNEALAQQAALVGKREAEVRTQRSENTRL